MAIIPKEQLGNLKAQRQVTAHDSSVVDDIYYNVNENTMVVHFSKGPNVYVYEDVDPEQFGDIVAAQSVGAAINNFAKTNQGKRIV